MMNRLAIALLVLAVIVSEISCAQAGLDYAHRYHKRRSNLSRMKKATSAGKISRRACRVRPSSVTNLPSVPATQSISDSGLVSYVPITISETPITSSLQPAVAISTTQPAVDASVVSSSSASPRTAPTVVSSAEPVAVSSFTSSANDTPTALTTTAAALSTISVTSSSAFVATLASSSAAAITSSVSSTSPSDIDRYLSDQNTVRAQHGAVALTWNDTLAAAAQEWANGCVFEHSGGTLGPYGENLAAGTGSGYGIAAAIQSWTDEASQYNPSDPVASHFTQVVWKATTEVGCGMQECNGIFPASYGPAQYYVCEYFIQGNVEGEFSENVQM
ncbi:PR-1-like protein [Laetiporus sulphureus 93-53]|uniref:PR-1-like protein n=1 Tax=Laetiporus sulphureus 93-53 TaxID=1314785 RepID=A0A165EER9_9APHY|nr:PR-1-like protein [Laetiporus sulphureus 93-53]KZT06894.1 PR-1-like protein [Laetiporus sulphureus 93-53]